MKKRNLKLSLSRETLRSLAEEESLEAAGGTRRTCVFTCTGSAVACCATGGEANSCPCS